MYKNKKNRCISFSKVRRIKQNPFPQAPVQQDSRLQVISNQRPNRIDSKYTIAREINPIKIEATV